MQPARVRGAHHRVMFELGQQRFAFTLGAAQHGVEQELRERQSSNRERLQVPRRPAWTRQTTVLELERKERDSFLEWRRGLAE